MSAITPAAAALIETFEGCSLRPEWPGFSSGVTLGYGVDIGADPKGLEAWKPYISAADYARLQQAAGVTGEAARPLAASLRDITVTEAEARTVFTTVTLPRYIETTLDAFPGADALPGDSFGALVSLVFNRGAAMTGKNRAEMPVIRDDIATGSSRWWDVVVQLAKMVVYWNEGIPTASNLPGRRLAEAALFARGLRDAGIIPAATLIKGDRGSPTAALQKALAIGADGDFGPGTMIAVWQRQKAAPDLTPTGVADADTLAALGVA